MVVESSPRRLLLVHGDAAYANRVRQMLGSLREPAYQVAHYTHFSDALTYLQVSPVESVLLGPKPADLPLLECVRQVTAAFPEIPVIGLKEEGDGPSVEDLQAAGVRDCLCAGNFTPELWTRTLDFCRREQAISEELAKVTARLDWLAHTDSLTGLLNRKGMEKVVMDELGRCRRTDEDMQVLLVDLDDFSRINATLGHGVGDLVLMAAARRISESISEIDQVGRCGTDRFVILLGDNDTRRADTIAEKIRLAIGRDVISAGEHQLTTTASLGMTGIKSSASSFGEVLAKAHFVLQRGKLKGGNRVARAATVADVEMIHPVEVAPDMVPDLLAGDCLQVSSQPIVNMSDGRIVSMEMLIRGPEGPLFRPDNLFRFCQEKNILTAVDLCCLRKCSAAAHAVGADTSFHVNIMPATLLQTHARELIRVLEVAGGGHCCLEISEQQLLGDPSVLVSRVRMLQEAGIRIAIDDVGFGNSCLESLITLEPQVIKVDKRLVQGVSAHTDNRKSLSRLLKIADVLGAEVVCEGIEEKEDYRVLLDMGVRYGQGYLFGRPQLCDKPPAVAGAVG